MFDRDADFEDEPFEDARTARRRRVRRIALMIAGACVLLLGAVATFAVMRVLNDRGKIVARVNGEPVYEGDVTVPVPLGAFETTIERERQDKLQRVCNLIAARQFLRAHRIAVPEREINQEVQKLRENPPSLGCPCCRYGSLDQYLEASYMTMDDLRAELNTQLGMNHYADELWKQTYPTPQSQQRLIAARRAEIARDYVQAWQIFFNTFQQIGQQGNPREVEAREAAKAQAAWERLQRGEAFDKVAQDVSEDQISRSKGGALGNIPKTSYGKAFEDALAQLKPGEVSRPVRTPYGFHIIKWEPISDDVLLALCKQDFVREKNRELVSQIQNGTKIQRG